MPPLEAMAAGAPVVVRGCGAVPETVGDAAIVVPAESGVCEIAGVVARVLQDRELRTRMRALGYERVAEVETQDPTAAFMRTMETVLA